MKKYLRRVYSILILVLTMTTLLACGKSDGDKTVIRLAHWDASGSIEKVVVEQVVKKFEEYHPEVEVEVDIISDYETQMPRIIASGRVHDVFLVPDGNFGQWVKTGGLLNLTEYINNSEEFEIENVYSTAVDRYRWNGKIMGTGDIYALPKDIGPQVMYYNKDLFDEFGVSYPPKDEPMDIYDALEMWKEFGDVHSDGSLGDDHIYGVPQMTPEGLVWSNGGDFLNETRTEATVNTTSVIEAYQFLANAVNTHKIIPSGTASAGTNPKSMFVTQRAATLIDGRWSVATFRNIKDFDWDIAPVPSFSDYPWKNAWSGSVGYAVFKNTNHPDLAYKLVEFFASKEGQRIMASTGFSIPLYNDQETVNAFLESEQGKKPENVEVFLLSAQNQPAGIWQYLPGTRWKTTLDTESSVLFSEDEERRKTASEFLNDINDDLTDIIRTDFPELFN